VLRSAAARLALSARAFHRVLKVARTIADLDGAARLREAHVAEALQYRPQAPALRPARISPAPGTVPPP
jgi:magnesium chelatase family protein